MIELLTREVVESAAGPADGRASSRLPWEVEDLFPPKPAAGEYGLLSNGVAVGCSADELEERVRRGKGKLPLVWTPQQPRMAPPVEVPFLFDAVRERLIRRTVLVIVRSVLLGVVLAGVILLAGGRQLPGRQARTMALLVLIAFGVVPAWQAWQNLRELRLFKPADMLAQGPGARYEVWLARKKLVATWALAGCILVVAACQARVGWQRSVLVAGLVKPLHARGWWRLFTCALLHGGLLHLSVNLFALVVLGRWIEAHSRRIFLPGVFAASAFVGSLASLLLARGVPYSVGASGGLMGMIGFLTVMGYRRRQVLPEGFLRMMLINIGLVAVLGLVAPGVIDNASHFGGLVGGLVIGWVVFRKPLSKYPGPLAVALGLAAIVVLGATAALATALLICAAGAEVSGDAPPLVEKAPGVWDGTARFRALYDLPGAFHVTAGGLDGQRMTSDGVAIAGMEGTLLKQGVYSFDFRHVDRDDVVYETRVVRVDVLPQSSGEAAAAVLVSPEEHVWRRYAQGSIRTDAGVTAVVRWVDREAGAPGGWRLEAVRYDAQAPAAAAKGGGLLPLNRPLTRPAESVK